MENYLISFVVPTISIGGNLESAISSIVRSKICEVGIEIYVIDQSNSKNTELICDKYNAVYISTEIKGISHARNLGINKSNGEYIAFLDDDAEISDNYMSCLYNEIKISSNADAISGRILTLENKEKSFSRHQSSEPAVINKSNYNKVLSSSMIVKRSVLKKIGLFDELFGVGSTWGASEETDVILRMLKAGNIVLYRPSIKVYHPMNRNSKFGVKKVTAKYYNYGLGRGALLKKHSYLPSKLKLFELIINPTFGILVNILLLRFKNSIGYCAMLVGRWYGYAMYR